MVYVLGQYDMLHHIGLHFRFSVYTLGKEERKRAGHGRRLGPFGVLGTCKLSQKGARRFLPKLIYLVPASPLNYRFSGEDSQQGLFIKRFFCPLSCLFPPYDEFYVYLS